METYKRQITEIERWVKAQDEAEKPPNLPVQQEDLTEETVYSPGVFNRLEIGPGYMWSPEKLVDARLKLETISFWEFEARYISLLFIQPVSHLSSFLFFSSCSSFQEWAKQPAVVMRHSVLQDTLRGRLQNAEIRALVEATKGIDRVMQNRYQAELLKAQSILKDYYDATGRKG